MVWPCQRVSECGVGDGQSMVWPCQRVSECGVGDGQSMVFSYQDVYFIYIFYISIVLYCYILLSNFFN